MAEPRDHGGGLDAAIARWGGARADWLDLSTGINPVPYPLPPLAPDAWTALPDRAAMGRLLDAARAFWRVPETARIVAAPGASALIAALPGILPDAPVHIPAPTYNEHRAAFAAHGARFGDATAPIQVRVHPNNPDGRWLAARPDARIAIIDESFCDVAPDRSLIAHTAQPGTIVLKSFGKFWGLAGLRLGFAIGHGATLSALSDRIGPWAVSGPALEVGAAALGDTAWAERTRTRLAHDAERLDRIVTGAGLTPMGGTTLFRLYACPTAAAWHECLARHRILSRVFPYDATWLRLGLPRPDAFDRVRAAFAKP
ncbi:pyridoxal phosphate-dependent class II aminotransferase [Maribius pontilimi]|uniref:Aminotransferase n=1 Tax=Palleronia pontilimi TaxID=1964209 RepID=A0A934MDM1_9RHOB|nr:threonine-phosphate decarboxylase [Palleronia pontilimi]MBJ3763635.1 pyridoxal phosphate-dependent class II aminotransferase [Palleronia pontilimi]